MSMAYRGRLAPTPTGRLHRGHGATFRAAWARARAAGGTLVYRDEDLDQARCQPAFAAAARQDLRTFGLDWDEGPDVGGPAGPYQQSQRLPWYLAVFRQLAATGAIYPSPHSRKDVTAALGAPQAGDGGEPVFPMQLRPPEGTGQGAESPGEMNWRFRVPEGEAIAFRDGRVGRQTYLAGEDFGDFLVWRRDGFPSYELAVVADDHAMRITEVVRGEDLLLSTARQLLLFQALGWASPQWWHAPLIRDAQGRRLAKRAGDADLLAPQGASPR